MTPNTKKPWYKSKTIAIGGATILVALYNLLIKVGINLPMIPEEIYIILGVLGIKYRMSATTIIGKK